MHLWAAGKTLTYIERLVLTYWMIWKCLGLICSSFPSRSRFTIRLTFWSVYILNMFSRFIFRLFKKICSSYESRRKTLILFDGENLAYFVLSILKFSKMFYYFSIWKIFKMLFRLFFDFYHDLLTPDMNIIWCTKSCIMIFERNHCCFHHFGRCWDRKRVLWYFLSSRARIVFL